MTLITASDTVVVTISDTVLVTAPDTVLAETSQSQPPLLGIEVVYAAVDQVWSRQLRLAQGSTLMQAIQASRWQQCYPELELKKLATGVYGKRQSASYLLKEGDRVEIYRPLTFDPKQSRRRRAIHRQKNRQIKKKVPVHDATI